MDSVTPADQNFRSRRQFSPTPDSQPPPPVPALESRSPPRPPKLPQEHIPSLTAANLAAATSGGYSRGAGLISGGDRDPAEDFYRSIQSTANGAAEQDAYKMAASTPDAGLAAHSLRSNGNGTTPKHPSLPPVRTALKPSLRSASSPLDNRTGLNNTKSTSALNTYANARQPSVKDLLKRFDQNNEQSSSTPPKAPPRISRAPPPRSSQAKDRTPTRSVTGAETASTPRAVGNTASTAAKQRSPPGARPTQRSRFAAEDQQSANAVSSQARATKLQKPASANIAQPSKSMTNLQPTSSSPPSQAQRPLFGEVLSSDQATPGIAYGIPARVPNRQISEPSLGPAFNPHQPRAEVDELSPSSPTAWYLGAAPIPAADAVKQTGSIGHERRSSGTTADSNGIPVNGVGSATQNSNDQNASVPRRSSKLPVPRHGSISSSESSTAASTRANSPFRAGVLTNGKLQKVQQRSRTPAGRDMSPSNRARTPTHQSSRGKARTPERLPSNNASLKAYISAPLPKTSPPLRSSHARAPISNATSGASNSKTGERTSPTKTRSGMKLTRTNIQERAKVERKIPDVPLSSIDFRARRDMIQRSYTKSMDENEQRAIRAANLRRLNARQNSEKNAAATASEARDAIAGQAQGTAAPEASMPVPSVSPQALQIVTSFQKSTQAVAGPHHGAVGDDSPTLGIPGTFVDDDCPPSAVSNVTGTTDIDNEPQIEAARLSRVPSHTGGLSSNLAYLGESLSPEQALFGMQESDQQSIKIGLDTTPVNESQQEPTPTKKDLDIDLALPGTFQPEHHYFEQEQPVFNATITTASPPPTRFLDHRPATPPDSKEDRELAEQTPGRDPSRSMSETYFTDEPVFTSTPETAEAPRLQLPFLRTALASSSQTGDEGSEDVLSTPATDIEYESSEVGGVQSDEHDPYGPHYAVREGLVSPTSLRFSSAWRTDSVDTGDEYSERDSIQPDIDSAHQSMLLGSDENSMPPGADLEVSPAVPPKPDGYSPLPSPRLVNQAPRIPSPQLPLLAAGEEFSFSFTEEPLQSPGYGTAIIPQWPPYSSPLLPEAETTGDAVPRRHSPPPASLYNRRPLSSYHSGQNTWSRRASDDMYSPQASLSTPRSSTYEEPDTSAQQKPGTDVATRPPIPATEEEKTAAEKQRKKLFQRSMVVKELIDTEGVYLKDMNVVEEIYKGTAEACPKLEPGDIKVIFRNTDRIVDFSTKFLDDLKVAAAPIYSPRDRSKARKAPSAEDKLGKLAEEVEESKDRQTSIGSCFREHLKGMEDVYTDFLKTSEVASTRLVALQHDNAVKVWLGECNLVAKDLTTAWDLDALLVKPVQRVTRYQLLLREICAITPEDHPDYEDLKSASMELSSVLDNINALKKRLHVVGKIVGRKRKESDGKRPNLAKAFRLNDKAGVHPDRSKDDPEYLKFHEQFSDDFLRLQVVLRDVQFYTRTTAVWVQDFLRYLSSMELIMRMAASPFPEIESKWARYNMSMRDMGTHILERHIDHIEKRVITPIEQVIAAYGPPSLAMKKRDKRRLDYEKAKAMEKSGKKLDAALADRVAQYEALNETLKLELPKLFSLTKAVNHVCLAQLVCIKGEWWGIWQTKVRAVLEESQIPKDIADLVDMFSRDFRYSEARVLELGIVNGIFGNEKFGPMRASQSTNRSRGLSINSEKSPMHTESDYRRLSVNLGLSPLAPPPDIPAYNTGIVSGNHSRVNSSSPATPDFGGSRPHATRPSTGRSITSDRGIRTGNDYNTPSRRESGSTYGSASQHVDGPSTSARPQSGLFHSAMPMDDGWGDGTRSSRASSRDRTVSGGYVVLYLAASLFEFNISATKQEAGYPYLTYQAGEIFDVVGEKGELWLAKNQDDPDDMVGWIWSKHFARLAAH